MNDAQIQSFFGGGSSSLEILGTSDPRYATDVRAFIEALQSYGVLTSRIHVEDLAVFQHAGIRKTIETFIERNPLRPVPLEHISIVRHVTAGTCQNDLDVLCRSLSVASAGMADFSAAYNIGLDLTAHVEGLDADLAARICEFLETGSLDAVTFAFSFPPASSRFAPPLRSALNAFLDRPVSKRPGITLAGFPFCFASANHFKALFNHSLGDLKGHIRSQRDTIRHVTGQSHEYLPPCRACRCRAPCYAFTAVGEHPDYEAVVSPLTQDTVAFVGGSLARPDCVPDARIVYAAPAEQGDMLRAILAGFRNILIIDGYFYSKFPCTTFEVMLALEQGINVFGSSSIGALRAVELDNYGMTGLGYVYEYLKRQRLKPYSIVAQTYRDDDSALTPPLVDLLYFLDCAVAEGIVNREQAVHCQTVAEDISFPLLSFEHFLDCLGEAGTVSSEIVSGLERFLAQKGKDSFGIKRKDARQLLAAFREIVAQRDPEHVSKAFCQARDKYLGLLYKKYRCGADLSLPDAWRGQAVHGGETKPVSRDRREWSAEETCRLAGEFFGDLDVVVADTTGYDIPPGSFIINIFFVPFYFLDYPLSCSTGNGAVFSEALASAYMELVERLPTHQFRIRSLGQERLDAPPFPLEDLPQYYNLEAPPQMKNWLVADQGYVAATDVVSGGRTFIPKFAVMSLFSGTDGNAAGNTLREAILYGLYEVVERDTSRIYLLDAVCGDLRHELRIDPATLLDDRCLNLIERLKEKGCRIALFLLPNLFELPCVRCQVFDASRGLECHGSTAVRADFDSAVFAALHEAYMQYISYFAGIRDDYRSFLPLKEARIAYSNAMAELFGTRQVFLAFRPGKKAFASISEELTHVVDRVVSADIRHILVANTSPVDDYVVKSVKVILPGTELWFVPEYKPSGFVAARARRTRAAIRRQIDEHQG